ncbi:MAG TPA: hypothetical protein VGR19_08205 [Allosphingosinicella sp.]|nr:hypothetical protein [Allosphingosinicella sp.]
MDNATYYARLEKGARYLASVAANDDERREHLGWANRYHRLVCDAAVPSHCTLVRAASHS